MANAAPNAIGALVAPTSFADYFRTLPDVYNGVYQGYLDKYIDARKTQEMLLRASTADFPADQVPSVFVFQDNNRRIRTVHHLHVVTKPMGQPAGPWDDVCLGFSSDIHDGHITALRMPSDDLFTLVPATFVPTFANMQANVATANAQGVIRPLGAGPDVEKIQMRRTIPVPHAYVQSFLFRNMTPAEAWNQVGTQIIADGRQVDCLVLLNFLRVALVATLPIRRGEPDLLPATALIDDVLPPEGDAQYFSHLTRKLRVLLPGATMAPTPNAVLQQVMYGQTLLQQTLQEATLENRAARLQEQEEAVAPKTFSEVFPAHAQKMRAVCNAGNDDENLPEFWRMFAQANGKKTVGFNLFQELCTQRASEPDSASVPPIVSANLYEQVSKFRMGSNNQEDLKIGISPFLMCPVGYHRAAVQRQLNDQYLLVHAGNAPTLADTLQILPATYNIPLNIYSLVDFIGMYSVVMDVLLGIPHPLAVRLRQHHRYWDSQKAMVVNALVPEAHSMAVLHSLRYLQLTCLQYFNDKMYRDDNVNIPDFDYLETNIRHRTFQNLPAMPAEFYYAQHTAQTARSGSSVAPSVTSTITAVTGTTSGGRTRGNQIAAPEAHLNPAWSTQFTNSKKSISTLRNSGGRLPKTKDGSSHICLAYHLLGRCMDNCGSITTHRALDAEERTWVQNFLNRQCPNTQPSA